MLAKTLSAYARLAGGLAGAALAIVFVVVLFSSTNRYFVGTSFSWSGEVAVYAMVFGTMFGAIHAYCHGRHMRFPFLVDQLPQSAQRAIGLFVDGLVLLTGVVLAVSGYAFQDKRGGILSSGIGVQMAWFQVAIMIGGLGLIVAAILRVLVMRGAEPGTDAVLEDA